jgi:hypothetical protein
MGRDPAGWREGRSRRRHGGDPGAQGAQVFVGSACATPRTLLRALQRRDELINTGVQLVHYLIDGGAAGPSMHPHRVWYVGSDVRGMSTRHGRRRVVPHLRACGRGGPANRVRAP